MERKKLSMLFLLFITNNGQTSFMMIDDQCKSSLRCTFAVKLDRAVFHFSLVLVPATCPAFVTLLKAPFNQDVPTVTYLIQTSIWTIVNIIRKIYGLDPIMPMKKQVTRRVS